MTVCLSALVAGNNFSAATDSRYYCSDSTAQQQTPLPLHIAGHLHLIYHFGDFKKARKSLGDAGYAVNLRDDYAKILAWPNPWPNSECVRELVEGLAEAASVSRPRLCS